ncbi:MAG: GDP-mannose 4,6-dehydratase [Acidobacteriia bacterium]|nr:GDP-mannose 4,6-dehydratase [Terriglobia bacterium]
MRALITGGAGFAGSHLAEHLLELRQEVTVLAAEQEDLGNLTTFLSRLRVVRADLRDAERLLEIIRDVRPGRIYHLAALSNPSESFRDPRLTYEVNFGGTLNLFLVWHRLELDCRFLLVSSSEVYGSVRPEDLPLREHVPLRPASPYAGSKAAGEFLAIQFFASYGLPIVRVRPFNHTGPRQSPTFVCSGLARQIAEINSGRRAPTVTVGNLQVRRDFSDVRDIVRGYHLLLEQGEPGEVYQLCSGRAASIEDLLRILTGFSPKPIRIVVEPSRVRQNEPPASWGEASKAGRAVGWSCQYALETTLRDLEQYWEGRLGSGGARPPG